MTDLPGSDRTLLERLNALKPSTVNLSPPSKSVAASTREQAKPLSKEDALSERLKSLRNQTDNKAKTTSPGSEINRREKEEKENTTSSPSPKPPSQPLPYSQGSGIGVDVPQSSCTENVDGDEDPLLYTDDQTLEELLADLESDQQRVKEMLAEDEHRRVTALLQELWGTARITDDLEKYPKPRKSHDENESESSSDDDSDGERMTRETDEILAQAVDEVEHDNATKVPSQPGSPAAAPSHTVKPNTTADATENGGGTAKLGSNEGEGDPFSLPAVPTDFQDQYLPAHPEAPRDDADFAASISSRMAALKVDTSDGPDLPSVPADIDPLGLPSAPTFAPADRPAPGLIRRFGFTDEDQKTWCVVCLEDGAIRCLGCDDEIYCARCWKEMHVGPSAGYDERGHRWEKFVRRRR
ncbi:uncharacterized protein F4812DRAFT_443736 [Daldinia caldariorum]|uniref:uncharacterized protein n=1 Tax=Daldinia caldariorum TaxID=326644 RepID=UPI002008DEBB|nr:uncharacterized protein F4812DRAFT_443736 [Daldinia caldariorum]KAI1464193.1 hypothetical protein F4812DRAFT_443736 [Daldinia caldariorum]